MQNVLFHHDSIYLQVIPCPIRLQICCIQVVVVILLLELSCHILNPQPHAMLWHRGVCKRFYLVYRLKEGGGDSYVGMAPCMIYDSIPVHLRMSENLYAFALKTYLCLIANHASNWTCWKASITLIRLRLATIYMTIAFTSRSVGRSYRTGPQQ